MPHEPGEQPKIANLVKLNTNENPYPPSPRVISAIRDEAQNGLQLYPDPESTGLRDAIAARHGLSAANVFLGNGSDEVLAHAFFCVLSTGLPLVDARHQLWLLSGLLQFVRYCCRNSAID
ncbi:aminotransferase class I/II-fold pyridoxal phosphate-dependent enzyme [Rhodoferax sp. PAMC 29310]|uniref:aminotransferase class I/II-fold pyridoxal phosphate-dependent enzyme n=1 Tax=Rhodoferax sp. PAMC 29310 TaxID=2822760 RepID=UPI00351D3D03